MSIPLHTPRFMLSGTTYQDIERECKMLIVDTEIVQGNCAGGSLDLLLRYSRDCCDGGNLHTTVAYQRLRLELTKGTLRDTQRAFLGDNLLLSCTPATVQSGDSTVGIKIYRLFAIGSTMKRKASQ